MTAEQKKVLGLVVLSLAVAAAATAAAMWYQQLDEGHKRYVQNLVRQLPDLPARYSV
jgi:hypothetical protein